MSQQINLFNPIFKQQKKYLSAVTMAQALALILIGVLAMGGYTSYRSNRLQAEANVVAGQLASAEKQLQKVEIEYAPRQRSRALEMEIKNTEAELESLQKVGDILRGGDLGNTDGYADYLRAFARQILDGIWLTGFAIHGAGTEIGLQGRALHPELVSAYINRLRREPVLQGKSFSALEMQVPQATAANPATQPSEAPAYIEFSLQSTGLSPSDAGAKGR